MNTPPHCGRYAARSRRRRFLGAGLVRGVIIIVTSARHNDYYRCARSAEYEPRDKKFARRGSRQETLTAMQKYSRARAFVMLFIRADIDSEPPEVGVACYDTPCTMAARAHDPPNIVMRADIPF